MALQSEEEELDQMMADLEEELNPTSESEPEQEPEITYEEDEVQIEEESEVEETKESEVVEPEESVQSSEEDTQVDNDTESTTSEFTPINLNVGGQDISITSQEDLIAYAQKGAKTFGKEPKQTSESDLVIQQGKLTADDLKLFVEAKNGSQEAIAKIAEKANVDVLDLDSDMAGNYQQQQQYDMPTELDNVAREIGSNQELSDKMIAVGQNLPDSFTSAIMSNADDLKAFSEQVNSGLAQEIIPQAINASMTQGGSFMDNYIKIGSQIMENKRNPAPQGRKVSSATQELRKRASSPASQPQQNNNAEETPDDIWNMSDEEFAERFDLN